MDRVELRKNRKRWQRARHSSFSLSQIGRYSDKKTQELAIDNYVGSEGASHLTANSSRLVSLNSGGLRKGNEVITWKGRIIGPGIGSQIF